jgi:DNA-binding NarL/FixJ family response regulator
MVSIALVEDHTALRESLALVLGREPDFEVVEQAQSLAEARERDLYSVDVAVIDIFLPDGEGTQLIQELSQRGTPGMLAFTISSDPEVHRRARQAGADEVLTKGTSIEELVSTIRSLASR